MSTPDVQRSGRDSRSVARRFGLRRSISGVDWWLVTLTATLCAVGVLSTYAATAHARGNLGGQHYLTRDVLNLAVGSALAYPILRVDFQRLKSLAPVFYLVSLFTLLAVLSPLGRVVNGARAWFNFGPVQLEPSEFAKIAVILMVAAIITEQRENGANKTRDMFYALGVAALPMLLILAEPALGIALVLGFVAVAALAVGGIPTRWILSLVAVVVLGVVVVLQAHLLKPYQEQRFTYFTSAQAADNSTGYQINESKIAIGDGGYTGRGFLGGSQTNGGFIPEQQTDFVFTVVAEEGGFVGAGALLLLYGAFLTRAGRIAARATDQFGTVVASGITVWFALQAFVNIGMTMGITPVTGVPLPFISYGGSSLFADLIAVALLIVVERAPARAGG